MTRVSFGTKIDEKLKDKALFIIQNKLNLSIKAWVELEFKKLIKEYEKGGKEK